ncbi:hypothetical protein [Mycobacterium sp. TY815]|uniref:hypothetical protein n=1 Tax=Mycobacterium sp. TY815 TaxID=3050581 RepID=UPI00353184C9
MYLDLGRNNIAVDTAEQALHFRRDLFEADHDRYAVALASALNNASAQYGALDDHVQAAQLAGEAVTILADRTDTPKAHEMIAAALNNYGLSSLRAGDAETAVQAAEAAVSAYRGILAGQPRAAAGLQRLRPPSHPVRRTRRRVCPRGSSGCDPTTIWCGSICPVAASGARSRPFWLAGGFAARSTSTRSASLRQARRSRRVVRAG